MSKGITLRLNKEFRTLYYHGASYVDPLLIVYARKNRLGVTRTGITTGKKVGGAVQRNRSRRIIRAAYAALAPSVKEGYDLVFVARNRTPAVSSNDLVPVLRKAFTKLAVFKEE